MRQAQAKELKMKKKFHHKVKFVKEDYSKTRSNGEECRVISREMKEDPNTSTQQGSKKKDEALICCFVYCKEIKGIQRTIHT